MLRDSGKLSYFSMSVYLFDSAVFLRLMTASILGSSILSRCQLLSNMKMILMGIVILLLLNLLFVSGIGFLVRGKVSEESVNKTLWIMIGHALKRRFSSGHKPINVIKMFFSAFDIRFFSFHKFSPHRFSFVIAKFKHTGVFCQTVALLNRLLIWRD